MGQSPAHAESEPKPAILPASIRLLKLYVESAPAKSSVGRAPRPLRRPDCRCSISMAFFA